MWQFTASLNWSVSRDTGRQGSQESGPILSPSPPQPISTHCIPLVISLNTKDICSYRQISIHYGGSVTHSWMPLHLSSLHSEHNANPWPHNMSSVLLLSLCAFLLPPPPPSLTKRLTRGSEALKLPRPRVRGSCPRLPWVARYFPGFKPRYFLHL